MKPSDYQVARLCKTCADLYEVKRRALVRDQRFEILAVFQQDALELHEGWLRRLEEASKAKVAARCAACKHLEDGECCAVYGHTEPPNDCALDELVEHLAGGMLDEPVEAQQWLVEWANRRAANVVGFLVEPMLEIVATSPEGEDWRSALLSARFVAAQALKVAGIKVEG